MIEKGHESLCKLSHPLQKIIEILLFLMITLTDLSTVCPLPQQRSRLELENVRAWEDLKQNDSIPNFCKSSVRCN